MVDDHLFSIHRLCTRVLEIAVVFITAFFATQTIGIIASSEICTVL